jgi:hypothetical protein
MTTTENVTDIQIYVRIEGSPLERAQRLAYFLSQVICNHDTTGIVSIDWEAIQ